MKKIFLVALFAMLMAGISVTACNAAPRAGCDTKRNAAPVANEQGSDNYDNTTFAGLQEGRANSIRVRDRATARQVQHQNDNGPGMTCFDHAMGLTSRLGQLFSDDKPKGKIPAASTRAFGQVAYQGYYADQWMTNALNVVIKPTLSQHALNFQPDSLSTMLGATQFPFWGGFMATINGYISTIMGYINQITNLVNTLNTLWTYFQQIVDLLNGMMPLWIMAWVPIIVNFWNSVVLPMINATIGAIMSTLGGIVSTITSQIMGALGSMTNFMNPLGPPVNGGGECARIQNLWGVGGGFPMTIGGISFQTGPIMRALTGTGVQTGNSYFSFAQLVQGGGPPGVGADFTNELKLAQPALNQDMMTRALGPLVGPGGALSGPSANVLKSWTVPPTGMTNLLNAAPAYTPGANTTTIINGM